MTNVDPRLRTIVAQRLPTFYKNLRKPNMCHKLKLMGYQVGHVSVVCFEERNLGKVYSYVCLQLLEERYDSLSSYSVQSTLAQNAEHTNAMTTIKCQQRILTRRGKKQGHSNRQHGTEVGSLLEHCGKTTVMRSGFRRC